MGENKDLQWLLAEISAGWTDEDWDNYKAMQTAFKAEAERQRLGQVLRKRIADLGLTQKQLADKLGIQPSELSRIITGRANYSANTHLNLLNVLGLKVQYVPANQAA